jgi:hypothetical protein
MFRILKWAIRSRSSQPMAGPASSELPADLPEEPAAEPTPPPAGFPLALPPQVESVPSPPAVSIQAPGPDEAGSPWVVVGAAVQGASHQRSGLPCQDAFADRATFESVLLVAVADGLGSATLAREGAALATAGILDGLESALSQAIPEDEAGWEALLRAGFQRAREQLQAAAHEQQVDLRAFNTTLLVAAIAPGWLAAGHIGDGGVVALMEDQALATLCAPQSGEYVNQTFPITLPNALDIAEFSTCRGQVAALALLTDGVQPLALRLSDNQPHPAFFLPLFGQLPGVKDPAAASHKLADFLASERVCARTSDDKTLVLVGRRAS